jgi:hypothetical protein
MTVEVIMVVEIHAVVEATVVETETIMVEETEVDTSLSLNYTKSHTAMYGFFIGSKWLGTYQYSLFPLYVSLFCP